MKIRLCLSGAALAVALAIANPANADLLGGSATGALNGTLSGDLGDIGAMADGGANASIGAHTDTVDRAGRRTRRIGGRVKQSAEASVDSVQDRARSTAGEARATTAAASAQAATTAAAGVGQTSSTGLDAAGGVDQSLSAGKSVEAGNRTIDATAAASTQGAVGAQRDADGLDVTSGANAQSAGTLKVTRERDDPAPTSDRSDHR